MKHIQTFESFINEGFESAGNKFIAKLKSGEPLTKDDLTINDTVHLDKTIKELPVNLTITGKQFLNLNDAPIKTLPKNLNVHTIAFKKNSLIKTLPDDLKVVDLMAGGSKLESLPANFKTNGYVSISGTPIKELPVNFTAKAGLDMSQTDIKELPKGITVNGVLSLYNTPVGAKYTPAELKEMFPGLAKAEIHVSSKK